ncbi:allantoicase [candidate division KSB1 bacterium]|nr:allantoicase [candidate division KSB1 bacterium]
MPAQKHIEVAAFAGLIDLAAERLGGEALWANDDFFAPKENLLKPGRGVFIPDKYTENGKWMDGWETRRKRVPGHDSCLIKLGIPGIIKGVDIDTNHFLGNHPPYAALEACLATADVEGKTLRESQDLWTTIFAKSPLKPGSQNLFAIADERCYTHVRLNIFPDGGVARLRIYGVAAPDFTRFKADELIDLVAIANGGLPVACSDMFFSPMENLIMPGRAQNMGDGWETRRRRGPGHDWIILKLGAPGKIQRIEIDTNHFKGNYPDMCSIDGCVSHAQAGDDLSRAEVDWMEILPKTKLQAHKQHFFEKELSTAGPFTHIRLNIFPDGGVSRLRVWGTLAK